MGVTGYDVYRGDIKANSSPSTGTAFTGTGLGTPSASADAYLEIGFKSGSPAAGKDSCDFQLRMSKYGCSAFDEDGDYSRSTEAFHADAPKLPAQADSYLA
ncbi:hypothetical protein [Streptomyces sp. Wb2n-11]|uniref:hypothetical protein n=1 Tax=Streptomyces sp. Wb2n-11 TaxID=1030533 RepID=UPI000A6AA916|nr:hypothetical protein [Streptomyces sp. Wb2n-11]